MNFNENDTVIYEYGICQRKITTVTKASKTKFSIKGATTEFSQATGEERGSKPKWQMSSHVRKPCEGEIEEIRLEEKKEAMFWELQQTHRGISQFFNCNSPLKKATPERLSAIFDKMQEVLVLMNNEE